MTLFRAMAWKNRTLKEARLALVLCILRGEGTVKELSRRFGVSRKTAYKWKARHESEGAGGLADRPPVARRIRRRLSAAWMGKLLRLHLRHPRWGPRKIRARAAARSRSGGTPSESTVKRWFARRGWVRRRPRRVMRGTPAVRPRLRKAGAPNAVWTVDFKGWFRTGDGAKAEPLTVRDLYSRRILAVDLVAGQRVAEVMGAMKRLFMREGLPERIRCDNGYPFGSTGCMGLTRLSAWWAGLGIGVEFTDPGHPEQNGAHEQMHRVLKAETARPPARTPAAQRRRSRRWMREYNELRPHEGIGLRTPSSLHRRSRRRYPRGAVKLKYPEGWERRWVKGNGEISRRGRRWFVGEAFAGMHVGLKPSGRGRWRVYFGRLWIGELREDEDGSIRPRIYPRGNQRRGRAACTGPASARSARLRRSRARR